MVKPVDMSVPSLLLEVAAPPQPRYNTRGVAAATALAPPPSAAALTRERAQELAQPCDNTHAAEAPTLVARREPRQRQQTGFFTAGAAPPPSALHAAARRTQAKKQKTQQGTLVRPRPSGPARLSSGAVVRAPTSDVQQPPRAPAPEPSAAIALESRGVSMPALVLGAGLEAAAAAGPLLSVAPAGTGDASPLDAKLGEGRTSPTDVMSAAVGWSVPLRPGEGAYPEVPILAPPPPEEVANPSEEGGPAPLGSPPPSLVPLGVRPGTAGGKSTAPPLPLAFSHLRRPWERTDQQLEQGVVATGWHPLAHSQVYTTGPSLNPYSSS